MANRSRLQRQCGRMLLVFGPILAVGAAGTVLAAIAAHGGWHIEAMRLVAATLGTAVMVTAILLFYQQSLQRRTADIGLLTAEAKVEEVLQSAMDAIITVDEQQCVLRFNQAAEKVFGWPRERIIGEPLDKLIPPRFRPSHAAHIANFAATGVTSRRMGAQNVLVGVHADGHEFPIEASISQHAESGRKFFTVILRDVTERVKAEDALRRSKDELRELGAVATSIREQEKSRVARELHDELAQALTALKMDVNWVRERVGAEPEVADKLVSMQNMLDTTVKATRRISADLRPLMLDDLGLIPAAEWLVNNFTQRHGIECSFSVDPADLELQDPYATAIFRILQESLTNVARHARASHVDVTLDSADGEVTLRVRDNGCGFQLGDPRKPNSFGIVGLRERVYLLDGEITVETSPGSGTTVEVRIPLKESAQRIA